MDLILLLCFFLGFIAFYYFNKFQESEKAYYSLHYENNSMKTRINDLQTYQKDVSKTFKILDSELDKISTQIDNKNNIQESQQHRARVSIFTPELIESLFPIRNRNEQFTTETPENTNEIKVTNEINNEVTNENNSTTLQHISNNYDKLLI